MDFNELIKEIGFQDITMISAVLRLISAGILGFLISLMFKKYNKTDDSPVEMLHSLIFLSMIICIAMMAIGNNLASAFGLVGAVSIIRFRTSVKSSRDMSFVFFTIVIGMGCGLGYILLTITGFILVSVVMGVVYKSKYGITKKPGKFLKLKVSYTGNINNRDLFSLFLDQNSIPWEILSVKVEDSKISICYKVLVMDLNFIDLIEDSIKPEIKLSNFKFQVSEL